MPQGVMVIEVLFDGPTHQPPTQADLQDYADHYGLTCPVLADETAQVWMAFEEDSYIPTMVLVRYDGTILAVDGYFGFPPLADAAPPYGGPAQFP